MSTKADAYRALFERLEKVEGFLTCERRLRTWDNVSQSEQPALFMSVGRQTPRQERGLPPVWELDAAIVIYARRDTTTNPKEDPGGDALLNLVEAISQALRRQPDEDAGSGPFEPDRRDVTTLGGLVQWARVEGQIVTDEGFEAEQAWAGLTIRMRWIDEG